MGDAGQRPVHPISFQLKRGHLRAVATGLRIFDKAEVDDMTPARFDILFLIHNHMPRWMSLNKVFEMEQRQIQEDLGLSAPTISKMLKRLTELGLVRRERSEVDRRMNLVRLTQEGIHRIRLAIFVVLSGRELKRHYEELVARRVSPSPRSGRSWRLVDEVFNLFWQIADVARHLGNSSKEVYDLGYEPDH